MGGLGSSLIWLLLALHGLPEPATCWRIHRAKEVGLPYTTNNVDWGCTTDKECTAKGSKCIGLNCQCSAGYIFNSDMTSCLKVAGKLADQCVEDIQCSRYLLAGGRCINNGCICAKGYYYMHGRCNPHSELLGSCEKDGDCYVHADFEAAVCNEGICRCSPGYYQREYRSCRRSRKEFGDLCIVNADCHFDEKAYCNEDLICAKTEGPLKPKSFSYNARLTKWRVRGSDGVLVGEKCDRDQECESLGGAECSSEGICACKRGRFASKKKDQCIPELGEACRDGEPEMIKKSICRNNRWACEGNAVVSHDRQKCRKASRKVGESCQEDEQCSALGPDAYCHSRKCACNGDSHYVESEEFCWTNKAYGEPCQQDLDCYMSAFNGALYCTNSACSCPNGTRLHSNGLECVASSADIGMPCDATSDCIVEGALCLKHVCRCPDNHYQMNSKCWPGVNANCTWAEECAPENSICLLGTCDCKEKFVAFSINSCLPVVDYGKSCLEDVQCDAATVNSKCIAMKDANRSESEDGDVSAGLTQNQKVCACTDDYYLKSGRCFRKRLLGEACRTRDDCYLVSDIELAICLNGFCACNWGYARSNLTLCSKARDIQPYDNSAAGLLADGPLEMLPLILLLIAYSFLRLHIY